MPARAAIVDVRDAAAVGAFVARVEGETGRVDVLVNTAGGVAGQVNKPVEEVSDADWRVIFAINLDGAFHFTRAVAPAMKRAGRGAIVNISSGAGRSYSLTGIQAYASAKAGLIGFTRQTARELGAHGIRVNCVAPGFVRSNPASERQWHAMGEAGPAAAGGLHRAPPHRHARGHRPRGPLLLRRRLRLRHRPDHQRGRGDVDAGLTECEEMGACLVSSKPRQTCDGKGALPHAEGIREPRLCRE